jgi:hypothetical protein
MNSTASSATIGPAIVSPPANFNSSLVSSFSPVDPLKDCDWDKLLVSQTESSFFQTTSWARVLHDTYGHRPLYFCRINNSRLEALLPVMEVSSWLMGRRGVSLPFTDICPALKSTSADRALYDSALEFGRNSSWKYFESRNLPSDWPEAQPSVSFYFHTIDLRDPDTLFKRLGSSLRRGIRKAQDEGLKIQFDTRPESMSLYYSLHCLTRRKHGVPPQPFRFFDNIGRHVLGAGQGFVGIARWQNTPVAAAVYLYYGKKAFYKFGASDYRFQHLRPNNLLMWEAMKRCSSIGCTSLHLGRTSLANDGLRRFKQSFAAEEEILSYAKYDFKRSGFVSDVDRAEGPLNKVFRCLPPALFRLAGALLYPHLS